MARVDLPNARWIRVMYEGHAYERDDSVLVVRCYRWTPIPWPPADIPI